MLNMHMPENIILNSPVHEIVQSFNTKRLTPVKHSFMNSNKLKHKHKNIKTIQNR